MIEPIEYPKHLDTHSLTEQELSFLTTPGQQALAKDWNIFKRKVDWLISEAVFIHNIMAAHEKSIELWKRIVWLMGLLGGGVAITLGIVKILQAIKVI